MFRNYIYLDKEKIYSLLFQFYNQQSNTNFISDFPQAVQTNDSDAISNQDEEIKTTKIDFKAKSNFLHEQAFAVLEKNIFNLGKIVDISNEKPLSGKYANLSFIRINSKGIIFDAKKYIEQFDNYNKIAESLIISSNANEIFHLKKKINEYKKSKEDRNLITQIENKIQYLSNTDKIAKENDLYKDESLLESFSTLASICSADLIELTQNDGCINYTSLLKKKNLLESESSFIRKYSHITDKSITIFGIVSRKRVDSEDYIDSKKNENMMLAMTESIMELEDKIYSSDNYIIDPIAAYIEL